MRSYYIITHGNLSKKDNTLLFKNKNKEQIIPIEDVRDIFIISEVAITSQVLKMLSKQGVVINFFGVYGNYIGSFYPKDTYELGSVLINQIKHYEDKEKRLYIAKEFVAGAIVNCSKVVDIEYESFLEKLNRVNTINELMGIEANFKKMYYKILEKHTGLNFGKRTKRPPTNELNTLISFGNSILYGKVLSYIYRSPLNPNISYLHEINQRRMSLSLDIAEIFKPVVVDSVILRLSRNGMLEKGFFSKSKDRIVLTKEGIKSFVKALDDRMEEHINLDKEEKSYSINTLVKFEVLKLLKHIEKEETYKSLKLC